jgi:hypothetical protein
MADRLASLVRFRNRRGAGDGDTGTETRGRRHGDGDTGTETRGRRHGDGDTGTGAKTRGCCARRGGGHGGPRAEEFLRR